MKFDDAVHTIPTGCYRHYKGNMYEVIGIARHSETKEPMVVYRALYGDGGLWVRPADMWNETVERGGKIYTRFCATEMPKAQEPRVITAEQLEDWLEPVYLEDIFSGARWALIADFSANWFTFKVTEPGFLKEEEFHATEYGRRWRCWNKKPTKEQREATLWMKN